MLIFITPTIPKSHASTIVLRYDLNYDYLVVIFYSPFWKQQKYGDMVIGYGCALRHIAIIEGA